MIRRLLLLFLMLPAISNAALHFGAGVGHYDNEYIFYNDKGYYEDLSANLGVYSDFDNSHMIFLDAHLYIELSEVALKVKPVLYAGVGGLFLKDTYNYTHKKSSYESEINWGVRFPMGVELMTAISLSVFMEVVPTYILSPNSKYETASAFGVRYYFY